MPPLGLVVTGFALVVFDLRVAGFDLAPDTLGWVLAAVGVSRLGARSRWFGVAVAVAVLGVVLGIPTQFGEPDALLRTIASVAETAFVFSVCSGVAEAARTVPRIRATAVRIRWTDLGLVLAGLALLADPSLVLVLVLALATLAVTAWFMIFLLSVRDHALLGAGTPAAGPRR